MALELWPLPTLAKLSDTENPLCCPAVIAESASCQFLLQGKGRPPAPVISPRPAPCCRSAIQTLGDLRVPSSTPPPLLGQSFTAGLAGHEFLVPIASSCPLGPSCWEKSAGHEGLLLQPRGCTPLLEQQECHFPPAAVLARDPEQWCRGMLQGRGSPSEQGAP